MDNDRLETHQKKEDGEKIHSLKAIFFPTLDVMIKVQGNRLSFLPWHCLKFIDSCGIEACICAARFS